ncbi:MAG: PLDc N-terminal domain-containing protein [Flavobacteriaceae bacterium]
MNNTLMLGGYEWIIILFFLLVIILLPLILLIDLLKIPSTGNAKLIWLIILIFLPFIGSILYLIMGRTAVKQNKY